jgi:hypothetical protein
MAHEFSEEGRKARFEQWERLGLDRVRNDLRSDPYRRVGSGDVQNLAWEWVRLKEEGARIAAADHVAPLDVIQSDSTIGTPLRSQEESKQSVPVVLPLHGIRTVAAWQRTLADIAALQGWRCPLAEWNYGVFSLLRFLMPWQRETKVRWFRRTYDALINNRNYNVPKANPPSIVAHSFGSYILGYSLLKYENIKVHKIILCGSILPKAFPWDLLIKRGQVNAVRNEYGADDIWARFVQWFVAGTGPSGESGFDCKHPNIEQQSFLSFHHSEYFNYGHIHDFWMPFLNKSIEKETAVNSNIVVSRPKSQQPWALYAISGIIIVTTVLALDLHTLPCQMGWLHPSFASGVLQRWLWSPCKVGGLVNRWRGDDSSANEMTKQSGSSFGRVSFAPGRSGKAFQIEGKGHFELLGSNFPKGDANRTMAMWVRVAKQTNPAQSTLAGYGTFGAKHAAYELGMWQNGHVYFSNWGESFENDKELWDQWHHIVVTSEDGVTNLYVDGSKVENHHRIDINTKTDAGDVLYVGNISGPEGNYRSLDGLIEDIRLYNRALSGSEVRTIRWDD